MDRTYLWFFYCSIIFVSMMALLMPGTPKKENVHGKMTVKWREFQTIDDESFTDETWMPTCHLLQRAAMRVEKTGRDQVRISCDEQRRSGTTGGIAR